MTKEEIQNLKEMNLASLPVLEVQQGSCGRYHLQCYWGLEMNSEEDTQKQCDAFNASVKAVPRLIERDEFREAVLKDMRKDIRDRIIRLFKSENEEFIKNYKQITSQCARLIDENISLKKELKNRDNKNG